MDDAAYVYQLVRASGEEAFNGVVTSIQKSPLTYDRLSLIFGAALDEMRPTEARYASCHILSRYYQSLPQGLVPFHVPAHMVGFPFPA